MGFKFDDYLIQIKKTEEDLRSEWRADAEKRAKLQLVIHTISDKENIKPTKKNFIGIVLYTGNVIGSFGDGMWAVPISCLY